MLQAAQRVPHAPREIYTPTHVCYRRDAIGGPSRPNSPISRQAPAACCTLLGKQTHPRFMKKKIIVTRTRRHVGGHERPGSAQNATQHYASTATAAAAVASWLVGRVWLTTLLVRSDRTKHPAFSKRPRPNFRREQPPPSTHACGFRHRGPHVLTEKPRQGTETTDETRKGENTLARTTDSPRLTFLSRINNNSSGKKYLRRRKAKVALP